MARSKNIIMPKKKKNTPIGRHGGLDYIGSCVAGVEARNAPSHTSSAKSYSEL